MLILGKINREGSECPQSQTSPLFSPSFHWVTKLLHKIWFTQFSFCFCILSISELGKQGLGCADLADLPSVSSASVSWLTKQIPKKSREIFWTTFSLHLLGSLSWGQFSFDIFWRTLSFGKSTLNIVGELYLRGKFGFSIPIDLGSIIPTPPSWKPSAVKIEQIENVWLLSLYMSGGRPFVISLTCFNFTSTTIFYGLLFWSNNFFIFSPRNQHLIFVAEYVCEFFFYFFVI